MNEYPSGPQVHLPLGVFVPSRSERGNMKLIRNKNTGRIHDVPDNHWALDPGQWPRGRKPTNRGVVAEGFAEEYEILDENDYEWAGDKGWVERTPSKSRSTRMKPEPES